jgi:hypothetical protein
VLLILMALFVVGNLVAAFSADYGTLLVSRVIAGLTQGPFYDIGAVVATRLAPKGMGGRAVGQMFTGLTRANVLGVPAGPGSEKLSDGRPASASPPCQAWSPQLPSPSRSGIEAPSRPSPSVASSRCSATGDCSPA